MLRVACLRNIRIEILALAQPSGDNANQAERELGASEHDREATSGVRANPGGEDHLWRTPRDKRELAMMMRDEQGKLQCPFGFDFASFTSAAASSQTTRNALGRVQWWLAIMELEKLGNSFGQDDASALPYRYRSLVRLIRRTRQEQKATVFGLLLIWPQH